jgi:hypothetical protein
MGVKKIKLGSTSSGTGGDVFWSDILEKPSEFTPSSHTHSISNITGLQDALDAKQDIPEPTPSTTTILTLASNQSTGANTTPITLTDMVFTYEANSVYTIDLLAFVQSAAATTGIGFIIDISSTVTKLGLSFFHQVATTGPLSGGSLIADDALIGVSSGMPNTGETFVQGKGILITGVNTGTAQFKFRSETNAVTTINANSKFIITKIS